MKGHELWMWMTRYPDGSEGAIGVMIDGMGHVPLQARTREQIEELRGVAVGHGRGLGQPVWLRQWTAFTDHERSTDA